MFKRFVSGVLLLLSLFTILACMQLDSSVAVDSSIIRVPDDYSTIQEAVDAANPGDIILVSAGTYYEYVRVNKTLSLMGSRS